MKTLLLTLTAFFTLTACGGATGEVGDSCTTDADCAEGLECHIEDHDDHDHEGEDAEGEEEEHEETGVCEEHEEHDHDDHDDHDDEDHGDE